MVFTGYEEKGLVAARRTVLERPQVVIGVERKTQGFAVAVGADEGYGTGLVGEGIDRRWRAIECQPDDFAEADLEALRRGKSLALARTDEQVLAIGRKGDAMRKMALALGFWGLPPDDPEAP